MIYLAYSDYDWGADFESIAISTTNVTLTQAKLTPTTYAYAHKPAKAALISVETNDIHMRFDGGDATAASGDGHTIEADTSILVVGFINLKNLRMSRVSGDGTVKVTYYY